jgi:hypothetical protein
LILILGFIPTYKSTAEIYHKMEGEDGDVTKTMIVTSFGK